MRSRLRRSSETPTEPGPAYMTADSEPGTYRAVDTRDVVDVRPDEGVAVWEEVQKDQMPKCVVHPAQRRRQAMDMLVGVFLLYTLYVVPFRVCFSVEATGFFLAFETFIDIVFILDLLWTFRTAVIVNDRLVTQPKEIAKHYLKFWFWIDFVGVFPFDLVISLLVSSDTASRNLLRLPKVVRLIRLTRLFRLMRIFKLTRLYFRWKAHFPINSSIFGLAKLFAAVLVTAHLLACFWFLMGTFGGEGTWLDVHNIADVYVVNQYIASFYWAITTITTVGYGDIAGGTTEERAFLIASMMIGVSVFSFAVGSMSTLVQRMESKAGSTDERVDQVNSYLKYRRFPKALGVSIREFYLMAWEHRRTAVVERELMKELPVSLRGKVALFLRDAVLHSNSLFEGTTPEFIADIMLRLQPEAALPGDVIFRAGDPAREMYIIARGTVEVCSANFDEHYKYLEAGSYFGEVGLFTKGNTRTASVRAVSYCLLDKLTRDDFDVVLELHPSDTDRLRIARAQAEERIQEYKETGKAESESSQEEDATNDFDPTDLNGVQKPASLIEEEEEDEISEKHENPMENMASRGSVGMLNGGPLAAIKSSQSMELSQSVHIMRPATMTESNVQDRAAKEERHLEGLRSTSLSEVHRATTSQLEEMRKRHMAEVALFRKNSTADILRSHRNSAKDILTRATSNTDFTSVNSGTMSPIGGGGLFGSVQSMRLVVTIAGAPSTSRRLLVCSSPPTTVEGLLVATTARLNVAGGVGAVEYAALAANGEEVLLERDSDVAGLVRDDTIVLHLKHRQAEANAR